MTEVLIALVLLLTAGVATVTVLTRDVAGQAVVLSAYGLVLTVLFVVLQAPDVALSQLAVGTVFLPLMVVLTITKIRRLRAGGERGSGDSDGGEGA